MSFRRKLDRRGLIPAPPRDVAVLRVASVPISPCACGAASTRAISPTVHGETRFELLVFACDPCADKLAREFAASLAEDFPDAKVFLNPLPRSKGTP